MRWPEFTENSHETLQILVSVIVIATAIAVTATLWIGHITHSNEVKSREHRKERVAELAVCKKAKDPATCVLLLKKGDE